MDSQSSCIHPPLTIEGNALLGTDMPERLTTGTSDRFRIVASLPRAKRQLPYLIGKPTNPQNS